MKELLTKGMLLLSGHLGLDPSGLFWESAEQVLDHLLQGLEEQVSLSTAHLGALGRDWFPSTAGSCPLPAEQKNSLRAKSNQCLLWRCR